MARADDRGVSDPSIIASGERFDRQTRFAPLGPEGQARLERARILLVGCGATGGVLAQTLVRSGVGTLSLIDRDVVELTNLPRQVLFEDRHVAAATPKAEAAAETLARIGGPTKIEAQVGHVDAENLPELARGAQLILDGTDNLETRYLINDLSVETGIPWIYAGVVGASGLVLPIVPGQGACLRCLFPDPPPPGSLPTCDSAGVLLPAVGAVASLAAAQALRLLALDDHRDPTAIESALVELDLWHGTFRRLLAPRDPNCPCCGRRDFPFLHRPSGGRAVALCGRNTVQIPRPREAPDLEALAQRLEGSTKNFLRSRSFLRFQSEGMRITLFGDGRALIEGTDDIARAQAVYDRSIGR